MGIVTGCGQVARQLRSSADHLASPIYVSRTMISNYWVFARVAELQRFLLNPRPHACWPRRCRLWESPQIRRQMLRLRLIPLSLRDHLFHLVLKQEEQGLDVHGKHVVEVFFGLSDEQAILAGYPAFLNA